MNEKPWMSLEVSKLSVENLWKEFSEIKENAEQHDFPMLLMLDLKYTPFYEDLMQNWDEYHAQLFTYGLTKELTLAGYKGD